MDFNNLFSNSNSLNSNSENNKSNFNGNMLLYPDMQNVNEKSEKKEEQNQLSTILQLLSLFNSKKMDLTSLLASPLGKKLGLNENLSYLLSLMNNKSQSKVQSLSQKELLPKIDSLQRLK